MNRHTQLCVRAAFIALLTPVAGIPIANAEDDPHPPLIDLSGNYEVRGFFGRGSQLMVSIRIDRSDTSRWLRVGERFGRLIVEKADAEEGVVILNVDGIRHTLKLAKEAVDEKARRT